MDILGEGREFSNLNQRAQEKSTWVPVQALLLQPEHQQAKLVSISTETLHKEVVNDFVLFCDVSKYILNNSIPEILTK